ncbi:MAG TPA: energy transducer TonB [Spirochaetota bacterium]|nr:energy transducer TonB [Spirochaetota bacterium]
MADESVIISIRNRRFFVKHLFRLSIVISLLVHVIAASGYFFTGNGTSKETLEFQNTFELERPDIEMDIPAELIGGDTTPAPVEKQEWIEGAKKEGDDPVESDINTNQISGDGTDKDGYLFSFNGDASPRAIVDFDLRQYYPREALDANIREYQVTVLVQIDENGSLVSANIMSGKAPYGFNEQAIKAVKRMRFSPGYKSGRRVKMAHYLPITFTLE